MRKVWAFIARDARLTASYPFSLWMRVGSVAATVAGFYYMAALVKPSVHLGEAGKSLDYFTYVVVNLAFMLILTSSFQAVSQTLRRDQVAGTLEAIFVTPTNVWLIALASAGWPLLYATFETALYFIVAFCFGMRMHGVDVGTLVLFLVLGMTCMSALGILLGAAVIRYKQSPPTTFLAGSAAAVLSGVLFPVSLFPPAIRAISWLLPTTHALNGLRAALLGVAPSAMAGDALWLAIAAAVLLPLSLFGFARAFEVTVREGTLAYY
jgi:ABC-2 type transport system permease protein